MGVQLGWKRQEIRVEFWRKTSWKGINWDIEKGVLG